MGKRELACIFLVHLFVYFICITLCRVSVALSSYTKKILIDGLSKVGVGKLPDRTKHLHILI